jgi:hypothetical protein
VLDEWDFENNGRFLENAHLCPVEISKYVMCCPFKGNTLGINPYLIMTENTKQYDGSTAYSVTGLTVEILKLVCEKINLTAVFLPPCLNFVLDSGVKHIVEL